ncbi:MULTISPECIES: sigma factor [unclassified Nonomuraea]|uniref:sigma factor n=1 Tax=unclassified Nonomuraea TaxID=2593643 RepID=UPI0033960198
MYREHWPLVCGFLLRRTRDPHLAEDLAQETFVKATRALLGRRGENPAAWRVPAVRDPRRHPHRHGRAAGTGARRAC